MTGGGGVNKADSSRRLEDFEQKSDGISPGLPCSSSPQQLPMSKPAGNGMLRRQTR